MEPLHTDQEQNAKMLAMCGFVDRLCHLIDRARDKADQVEKCTDSPYWSIAVAHLTYFVQNDLKHASDSIRELKKESTLCGVTEEDADAARDSGVCGDE